MNKIRWIISFDFHVVFSSLCGCILLAQDEEKRSLRDAEKFNDFHIFHDSYTHVRAMKNSCKKYDWRDLTGSVPSNEYQVPLNWYFNDIFVSWMHRIPSRWALLINCHTLYWTIIDDFNIFKLQRTFLCTSRQLIISRYQQYIAHEIFLQKKKFKST